MARNLRDALISWYDLHRRDLPWRRTKDPYAIWVSEIMLQQTRVETVIPYYERFLERFPTPGALARASEDEVMSSWSGLGYYRRARLLHQGVRDVVARYGGQVPEDPEARRSLPGVGRYTAGAIGSIAFDRPEPIVDGNVARVLSRVELVETPLGRAETERKLWDAAARWALGPRPGDLNQALMELGARVCTPISPSCDRCPIAPGCRAREAGRVEELPIPRPRKAPKRVQLAAVVPEDADGRVWLARNGGSLFGGLWGVPMAEGRGRSAAEEALRRAGIAARLGARSVGAVEHVLTHRRLDVRVWRAVDADAPVGDALRPFAEADLREVGLSRLTWRLLETTSPDNP